jgi:hypothetical protein
MGNNNNGNQFRDDEILVLDQLRDGKSVRNIFPKIGGRLRLAHEENEQLPISTEIVRYDENLAVVRAITTTMKGAPPGSGIEGVGKIAASKRRSGDSDLSGTARLASGDQRIRPAQSSLRNVCREPHRKQLCSELKGSFSRLWYMTK